MKRVAKRGWNTRRRKSRRKSRRRRSSDKGLEKGERRGGWVYRCRYRSWQCESRLSGDKAGSVRATRPSVRRIITIENGATETPLFGCSGAWTRYGKLCIENRKQIPCLPRIYWRSQKSNRCCFSRYRNFSSDRCLWCTVTNVPFDLWDFSASFTGGGHRGATRKDFPPLDAVTFLSRTINVE